MPFNSFPFLLLFLPIVVCGARFAASVISARAAQAWLIAASLVFYGWAEPRHLPLLIGSVVANAWLARRIAAHAPRTTARKRWLQLGLAGDVALLASFKYVNLLAQGVIAATGLSVHWPEWNFPLGISFFTVLQIMVLVDVYEGLVPPSSVFDHMSFVVFFPTLTSGPLARSAKLLPQLRSVGGDASMFARGLVLLASGLFKKVVIADSFARFADPMFAQPGAASTLEAWIGCVAYALQIFFDFSGYSDAAIGAGLMLGIELPVNFRAPYRSKSIIEFWQRWHITLSQFITTYLYTPMIRWFKRATVTNSAVVTIVAMAIAGLWHGPSLNYVVFGLLHGVGLATNQIWRRKIKRPVPPILGLALTLGWVLFAFVFFRARNWSTAIDMLHAQWPGHNLLGTALLKASMRTSEMAFLAPAVLVGFVLAFWQSDPDVLAARFRPTVGRAIGVVGLLLITLIFMNSTMTKEFVYFAF